MASGKIFKNIFKKVLAKTKNNLYNVTMNKIFSTLSKSCLTAEYRTPFIGSDNQSWAHGRVSGIK
jgi:hypothetical protein